MKQYRLGKLIFTPSDEECKWYHAQNSVSAFVVLLDDLIDMGATPLDPQPYCTCPIGSTGEVDCPTHGYKHPQPEQHDQCKGWGCDKCNQTGYNFQPENEKIEKLELLTPEDFKYGPYTGYDRIMNKINELVDAINQMRDK